MATKVACSHDLIDGCSRFGALVKVVMPLSLAGNADRGDLCFHFVTQGFVYGAIFITASPRDTAGVGIPAFLMRNVLERGFARISIL